MPPAKTTTPNLATELHLLARPYPAVDWKVQATNAKQKDGKRTPPTKALLVPYIDARAVQARLDYVFGGDWETEFVDINGGTKCGITIAGRTRWDVGEESDGAMGKGPKARFSDALKRAGVAWGIGRFLYDLPAVWVPCSEYSKVSDTEMATIRARYKAWTKRADTIKLYGEVLGHFQAETPPSVEKAPEAPETAQDAAKAEERPESHPEPKAPVDGVLEPKNTLWPQMLVMATSHDYDPDIQAMALEMAGILPGEDKDVVKATLKLLSPEKAEPILAILKTPSAKVGRQDKSPGAFSHAATGK